VSTANSPGGKWQDSVRQAFIAVRTSSSIYHIDITAHQLGDYKKGLAERAPPLCVFQTPDYNRNYGFLNTCSTLQVMEANMGKESFMGGITLSTVRCIVATCRAAKNTLGTSDGMPAEGLAHS